MTEADSIVRDPNVAVEFARQIFPPEVQQSMVGRKDYEVFREGVHGAVKGLYTAYEIGMQLRTARREMEMKDERIRSLEARTEAAERKLRKTKAAQAQPAGQGNPIVEERVTSRLISFALADRETTSMFAMENAKGRAYEKGFHEGRRVGIEKTKEKLAEEVCRCKNRGFRHGWIKASQAVEALRAAGIDSASPLYHCKRFPFSAFEVEKSDDEGNAA
ncbi:hypothetical protein CsSME_00026820 [Camellia sinensis var. sinensis]